MKHKLSIYHRMQQRLTLTPLMRQSMRVLNMSTKELNEYISSLLEQNPFLQKRLDKNTRGKDYAVTRDNDKAVDYANNRLSRDEDPRLLLVSQLKMVGLNDKALEIAEYLIYEMDDNGYIQVDMEEAARDLFVTPDIVEKVVAAIQEMEPVGIGARDAQECLELQLKRMGKEETLEYTIVSDFINELARNDAEKIAETLDIDKKEVAAAIKKIKRLNPKPASTLLAKNAEPVIPDLIAKMRDNDLFMELNREWVPQLRLYNPYEDKLEVIKDPEVKEFLKKNMDDAKGLIDNLKRREETMCRVADYILKHQKESLSGDISQIKSLTISVVAKDLKMHPSTISRTVSNKYIQINDKVVPLKSLLSHAIKKENGELASKTSVKSRIKEMVSAEDKNKPLSDNTIRMKLEDEGIVIKRRTVAKYRESLRILPTHLRRRRGVS
ncbi:RNA polymerase factor sigma-54 [Omnitrophica bacterium]|nr:RNA polymerase factor sigma-54 [Candidatus Omnitrophota bacterium]